VRGRSTSEERTRTGIDRRRGAATLDAFETYALQSREGYAIGAIIGIMVFSFARVGAVVGNQEGTKRKGKEGKERGRGRMEREGRQSQGL